MTQLQESVKIDEGSVKGKILILGAAGFIGGGTARLLRSLGYTVVASDKRPQETFGGLVTPLNCKFIQADLSLQEDRGRLLRETGPVQHIINFSGLISVPESWVNPAAYVEANAENPKALLLDILARQELRNALETYLFSSTAGIYDGSGNKPLTESSPTANNSPYGSAKLEHEIAAANLEAIFAQSGGTVATGAVRYFNAAGVFRDNQGNLYGENHVNCGHLIPRILHAAYNNNPVSIFGNDFSTRDGTCVRDYVSVTDLARAHLLTLAYLVECRRLGLKGNERHRAFNLGSGNGYSVKEVINTVKKVTGLSIRTEVKERRGGDADTLIADPTLAKETLGWQPTEGLDEIVQGAAEWHKKLRQLGYNW